MLSVRLKILKGLVKYDVEGQSPNTLIFNYSARPRATCPYLLPSCKSTGMRYFTVGTASMFVVDWRLFTTV